VLAEDAFEISVIESEGRTTAAELVDLNGDGRTDLFTVAFVGFPPDETRWVRVFFQGPDGELPAAPSLRWALPPGCAAYDLGDVSSEGGVELLLLSASGVHIVSFEDQLVAVRQISPPGGKTLAAGQDERGMDRARLVWTDIGPEPWIVVPLTGETVAMSPEGELRAVFETGTRANYLVPPRPGPVFVESEFQVFLDVPVMERGDVDGDGRTDVVSASRHDIRVFTQREDGSFPRAPDQLLYLRRVSEQDHLRGSGAVRAQMGDLNGDGRLDAVISEVAGALTDARTRTSVHLNRNGTWNLDDPDLTMENTKAWTADQLVDLDGDGLPEMLRIRLPITVWEIVEMLISQAVDAEVTIHKVDDEGLFMKKPYLKKKLDIPFSFDTGRPRGFIPTVNFDLNADGHLDFLSSGKGDSIEVFLGGPEYRFKKRQARQKIESQGRVRFGDVNGDGLGDFVLYSPRRPGVPLRIATNRGILPGSPPSMTPAAE
jgi:hypothetical protein